MNDQTLTALAAAWTDAKHAERQATEARRAIEDRMLSMLGITEGETSTQYADAPGGWRIKVAPRVNYAVDRRTLMSIAANNERAGDALEDLIRWKAELNAGVWARLPDDIRCILAPAITAKPSRASFSITCETE